MLSLAGVYWQAQQTERQMQREAVEKFLDDYSAAFVEIEYIGNRRVPSEALLAADKEALRKEVRGVYAACTRLALEAPELADSATSARNVLGDWE